MESAHKIRYRAYCKEDQLLPLFLYDWWLDATCGADGWEVAMVVKNDVVRGVMPYCIQKKMGMTFSKVPLLTGFIGPWLNYPPDQKYVSRMSFETEVLKALVVQLPSVDLFRQKFHYSFQNWLPFYWDGYQQTTRYSYILTIDNLTDTYDGFKSSVRGKIRKASELVRVQTDMPLTEFYRLLSLTFHRQGESPPISFDYLSKIDNALLDHGQRKIFHAVDTDGKIHSALYLSWDTHSAYVHMIGEDPTLRASGAGILLVWEAIQYTVNKLQLAKFDFLGSMIEPIETVRRSFGAEQVAYHQVEKVTSRLLKFALAVKGSRLT